MAGDKARLLFVRNFRRPTGGNVKVRDYFAHAAAHPRAEARIWFAPGSRHRSSEMWAGLAEANRAGISIPQPTISSASTARTGRSCPTIRGRRG